MDRIAERIETERLVLRPYADGDAERVLDVQSRLDVIRWLDNPPFTPMSHLDEARTWIEKVRTREAERPGTASRAIEVRGTRQVVGGVLVARLERIDGGHVGEHELGWRLNPDALGHGYATEAAAALAAAAFAAGHERLVIGMYPDNDPSAAVARRLGARELGVRDDPWYGDESLMFELTP